MRESRNVSSEWRTTELHREIINACQYSWSLSVLLWFNLHIWPAGFSALQPSFCHLFPLFPSVHFIFLKSRRNMQLPRNGQCSSTPGYLGFASWPVSHIRGHEPVLITLNSSEKKAALFCSFSRSDCPSWAGSFHTREFYLLLPS